MARFGKNPLHDALSIPVGVHAMVLGVYIASDGAQTQMFTRVRVLVPVVDAFRFRVTRANGLTRMWDRVFPGAAAFGNPRLDREFRLRTTMGGRVRTFFLDGRIRADLIAARPHRFALSKLGWPERRRWSPDVRQLQVVARGLTLERAELVPLLDLCQSALSRLLNTGAVAQRRASEARPGPSDDPHVRSRS